MSITLHDATAHDIPEIEQIYAFYVLNTFSTFEEVPPSSEELDHRRSAIQERSYPFLVAKHKNKVVGYAYVTPYRHRSAYRYTVEHSIYVHRDFRTQGIGATLLESILLRCKQLGLKQIIAVIGGDSQTNAASLALHQKFGFEKVAHLPKVGLKFDQWIDSIMLQCQLDK